MSWQSPNPYVRSLGGLVNVKETYVRKRKTTDPPENVAGGGSSAAEVDSMSNEEARRPTIPSLDAEVHSSPIEEGAGRTTNPNLDAEVHSTPIEDGAGRTANPSPDEEEEARPDVANPSSPEVDLRAPAVDDPANDLNFEGRTKRRMDRPAPPPPKPPLPPKRMGMAAYSSRSQVVSEREPRRPPAHNPFREDGTFTTRIHYNGVIEVKEGCGRHYVNGEVEYVHKCDPDRWSKLEVDDALEKVGVDVTGLEYYYVMPRSNFDNGSMLLSDNKSAIHMAELGVQYGVINVYAIQEGGLVIDASQLTQENVQSQFEDGVTASESEDDERDGDGNADDEGQVHGDDEDWVGDD